MLDLKVVEVQHYTDKLFRIRTERPRSYRFTAGEFVMIGLEDAPNRAYSITSGPYDDYIEFYSIKVQDGPLTSKLQHVKVGDEILVNPKAVGTLVHANLKPGRNLYLLATGTGIAPFMSIIRGVDTYEHYDNVIVVWGTRIAKELAFKELIDGLNGDEIYSQVTEGKLKTYFTCTREDYENTGRVTTAMYNGDVQKKLGLVDLSPIHDRVMICGSMPMNEELIKYLEDQGFTEGDSKTPGEYVVEKAFVG